MKDYQSTINNQWKLPRTLYRHMLCLLRDFKRIRMEYDATVWDPPNPIGEQLSGGTAVKPTEELALKRAALATIISAVENAIECMPEEYRTSVLDNIIHEKAFPNVSRATYFRYKRKFLYLVAKNLYLI